MQDNHPSDRHLDASGLLCPLPVLKARKALSQMAAGELLCITATDPAALKDFPAFCQEAGHLLVDCSTRDKVYTFKICKQI